MNKVSISVIILLVSLVSVYPGYCQAPSVPVATAQVKSVDVNKDGNPDVTYYGDGKYVSKVEADTNYDGKPDIQVNLKDGKFESAEVDIDYDGKTDKKFTDAAEFSKWLNEYKSDFKDNLDKQDWRYEMMF
jgi:hypothetical protein